MSKSNGEIVAEVLLGGGALFALLALLNVVVWAVTGRGTLIDALIGPAVVVGLLVFMVLALGLGSERYPAPSRDDTPDRPPPATAPEAHTHLLAERVTVTERLYVLGALLYLLAYLFYRRGVLALFGVLYGTFATLLLTSAVIGDLPVFSGDKFAAYRILGLGAAYLFLAYGMVETRLRPLAWWLYGSGTLAVLSAALWLSGWKPEQSMFWELSYPLYVFGAMFISTKLKSRAMLFFGAVFLVGYIFKITAEYFQDSLSWPLLLILAGFLLMGVGYLTFYLNKRYLKAVN
jgi:hypothetical protein